MNENLESILHTLDMDESNGLIDMKDSGVAAFQHYFISHVKKKINLDAVFFLRDSDGIPRIPLIYFSAMDTYDPERIAQLHRLSWNTGEAPLLFVVLPDQLLVYNNYASPTPCSADKYNSGMLDAISLVSGIESQRRMLSRYHRTQMETGEFWRHNRFDVNTRVDTSLMNNLKAIRRTLLLNIKARNERNVLSPQNQSEIVHALLSRSILIKYLEERTDSHNASVFPNGFFGRFLAEAKSYTDVLADKKATYALYKDLENKFNGDMFSLIDRETEVVTQDDLAELRYFILGESDLASRQQVLWPLYSFNVIPIQLISSIYELFYHLAEAEPDEDDGTYYTPFHLVEMLTDEVLSWDGPYQQKKILDPSCGSGIFLVEAYRRLVFKWIYNSKARTPGPNDLVEILKDSIYGIDCNKEALRIASFSLNLAMCDFLEPKAIWDDLHFPKLIDSNLFHSDFFSCNEEFENINYDLVIGNPPWKSELTAAAEEYIEENGYIVGDNQIAQAFTWRAADICSDGIVCFLLPSKGVLFNRSPTTREYRKRFFDKFDVSVIINFSAFRRELFEHASGPAVAVIYRVKKTNERDVVFYCTPKPLYTVEDKKRFLIEPYDICRLPYEQIIDDYMWKIAMWGSPRDFEIIRRLHTEYPKLRTFLDNNEMTRAEGYKRGNRGKICKDFLELPYIPTRAFKPGKNARDDLPKVDFTDFECTAVRNREIFRAPHLIIKQSHKEARFLADVLDFDAVFNHSFLGVHGDENTLKYLCLLISSKMFSYYQIMTNRRWLVERDELEAGDILDTPIPTPTSNDIRESGDLFDLVFIKGENIDLADRFAYRQYNLLPHEISLIEDAIDTVYEYYSRKGKSRALKPPSEEMLRNYSETLQSVLRNSLNQGFNGSCHVHFGDAPLIVAELNMDSAEGHCSMQDGFGAVNLLLEKLDEKMTEARSGSVFVKRNVRIYNNDCIYIIKPKQARYWNYSAACRDADDIFADVMRAWGAENE